jgi:hypothetical protein
MDSDRVPEGLNARVPGRRVTAVGEDLVHRPRSLTVVCMPGSEQFPGGFVFHVGRLAERVLGHGDVRLASPDQGSSHNCVFRSHLITRSDGM